MKFKAKLTLQHTQLLYNLITPLSRLQSPTSSTPTVLYLDNDKMVLSTRGSSKHDSEGIFCFAELLTTDGIFHSHIIQSIAADNAILMEICLIQFRTALKDLLGAQKEVEGRSSFGQEVTIKLAKRNGGLPHLCLDTRDVFISESGMGMHHMIPVKMMSVEEFQYHVPPRLGMPDVQLALPKDRPLKTVVDRLRTISPQIFLEASMNGFLTLRLDGDGASIRTTFNKLIPIHEDCKSSQEDASQTQGGSQEPLKCTVKVDSKKLYASLHWQGTFSVRDLSSAVLCLWENEMLVLDVTLNPEVGRFMYYVPVHYISPDEL